jgi:hypothetical protein
MTKRKAEDQAAALASLLGELRRLLDARLIARVEYELEPDPGVMELPHAEIVDLWRRGRLWRLSVTAVFERADAEGG